MLSVVLASVVLFLGSSLVPSALTFSCGQSQGTTRNIEDIFKGRCNDYIEKINPKPFCGENKKSCTELFDVFRDTFTNRNSCDITADLYLPFINASRHSIPRGKSMFWQGVVGFVQELTYLGKRFFTLEDTLYGYTLNKLNWCLDERTGDFNYTLCPSRTACPRNPQSTYWEAASREFARSASGMVQVMINGSRSPPYNKLGFFGRVELPAINTSKVDKIRILLVHFLDLPVVEDCNGESIKELKATVKDRGLEVECIDDPAWIRHYMCVDHPDNALCTSLSSKAHSDTSFGLVLYILLWSITYILSA